MFKRRLVHVFTNSAVDLYFADDVALLTDSWLVMVAMGMEMEKETQNFGINISVRKSELIYMYIRAC